MPAATVATINDLPWELAEKIASHLDGKDVWELMMVNKRLYSSYAMNQSIVFGKHVAVIAHDRDGSSIKKLVDSSFVHLNATLLPLTKQIVSCDKLDTYSYDESMFLGQLKSVNQLDLFISTKRRCRNGGFFTHFRGSVKKSAIIGMGIAESYQTPKNMMEQLGKFIENELNECERITLQLESEFHLHVCRDALMKTQIKMIAIETSAFKVIDWIANQGIPSDLSAQASGFLSQVQGLQRVDRGENHSALVSRANELRGEIKQGLNSGLNYSFPLFREHSLCFRRQINPATSCIYVFHALISAFQFMAFYMPSQ